nr:unnamed protein product [Salmonella enterica subsp. enterica serovar Gallinarum str. 287/91]
MRTLALTPVPGKESGVHRTCGASRPGSGHAVPAIRPAVRCPGALFRYPVTSLICLLVSLFVGLFVYNISIPLYAETDRCVRRHTNQNRLLKQGWPCRLKDGISPGSHYVTRWVAAIRHVSARYGTNTRLHRARSSLNPLPSCQWKWLKK